MRATLLAILVLVGALLAGCGSSSDTTTSTAGGGSSAQEIRLQWERSSACKRPPGASRWSCSVGSYRCQGVVTDHGWSIDCAKPGRAIAFMVRPG